jgi:hypothetical protein
MEGVRGKPPADVNALVQATIDFSRLIEIGQNFKRIDIKPLMVLPKGLGVKVLDALFVSKTTDTVKVMGDR